MQLTTGVIALLAAANANANALAGAQHSLEARQVVRTVTVQFLNAPSGCNGPRIPVGPPQVFTQAPNSDCINISGTSPRGVADFAVLQNNATVRVRLYANDLCDENDPILRHFDILSGTTFECSHLDRGVASIKWNPPF